MDQYQNNKQLSKPKHSKSLYVQQFIQTILYKPSIINDPKIEELFNNKDTLSYWIKNNQLYLNRHLNSNAQNTKPTKTFHTKNNSMIIHKKNSIGTVNNSMSDTKKTSSLNRSLDMLHYELQNTAIDDESNDERDYE